MHKYDIWYSNLGERREGAKYMVEMKKRKGEKLFCLSSVTGETVPVLN
jgi:hypothetical protein